MILRSPEAGVHGLAEIGFEFRDGATQLAHLYERHPLRVLFPAPAKDDLPTAVLVTTSGGLVAGDRLDVSVRLGEGAAAHVTGSAAEKIYRSTGATTRIEQILSADAGAWLEYLPLETIVFDRARLRRNTRVKLAAKAGFLGGGILVFGRIAHGERLTTGLLHEVWEVYRDGELTWGDALHLDGDIAATMIDPACFDGAAACATLILAPQEGDPRGCLDAAREVQRRSAAEGLRAGVTAVNGLLVARWLGDPARLRRAYADLACHLRQAAMGLPPRLSALWHV
ncbi:MAG TPA: urease accessory protein UreD [Stellaceae bacterium]|nr:urease accessory protein UreD [Stellaceae bacterium]